MSDIDHLMKRIDAEFGTVDDKIKKMQIENLQQYRERQIRLETFGKLLDELRSIWQPRLEALRQRFGDRVSVTPRFTPSSREATFEFQSNLAKIRLKFSVYADSEINHVNLTSDLDIAPILIRFDGHAEMSFPFEAANKETIASWIDDRIISFVRSYLTLHESNMYLKDHMVEDPITRVKFAKYAAGATFEWKGATYYFVDEQSRNEFTKQNRVAAAAI